MRYQKNGYEAAADFLEFEVESSGECRGFLRASDFVELVLNDRFLLLSLAAATAAWIPADGRSTSGHHIS